MPPSPETHEFVVQKFDEDEIKKTKKDMMNHLSREIETFTDENSRESKKYI